MFAASPGGASSPLSPSRDDLGDLVDRGRDDWQPRRFRFEQRHAERLELRRQGEDVDAPQQRRYVVAVPEKPDAIGNAELSRQVLERRSQRSVARNHHAQRGDARRGQGEGAQLRRVILLFHQASDAADDDIVGIESRAVVEAPARVPQ